LSLNTRHVIVLSVFTANLGVYMTKSLSIARAARRARVSRNTIYGLLRRRILTPDHRGRVNADELDVLFPPPVPAPVIREEP